MPYPTPAYPLELSPADAFRRAAAHLTPHASRPAVPPPVVLGGVLRSDSPFLDVTPSQAALPPEDGMVFLPYEPVAPEPLGQTRIEVPLPDTPFDRAAVARARARARRAVEHVEATVMSDDGVAEHICDVTEWLAGATVRELDALARAGWSGDEALDVADTLADDDPEVADVLRHARRTDAGVSVEIDGGAVMEWLARHRPAVAAALADTTDAADDDAVEHETDEASDEG